MISEEDKQLLAEIDGLLADVKQVLNRTQRIRRSFWGKVPWLKGGLRSYEIRLMYQKDRLEIARSYLDGTIQEKVRRSHER